MFAPYCPRHESRVLLGYESVIGIEPTSAGLVVTLRCHCGELVSHDPSADHPANPDRAMAG